MSFLMLSYQLYCFFTCQMLDVKADGQHAMMWILPKAITLRKKVVYFSG